MHIKITNNVTVLLKRTAWVSVMILEAHLYVHQDLYYKYLKIMTGLLLAVKCEAHVHYIHFHCSFTQCLTFEPDVDRLFQIHKPILPISLP